MLVGNIKSARREVKSVHLETANHVMQAIHMLCCVCVCLFPRFSDGLFNVRFAFPGFVCPFLSFLASKQARTHVEVSSSRQLVYE